MDSFTRLANAINGQVLDDALDRDETGPLSSAKRYARFPEYIQNTVKLFNVVANQTAADILDLTPSTNFLKLTQLNEPFIQSLLIREAGNRGLMCHPALGFCQNLRNEGVASTPKITTFFHRRF